MSDRIDQTPTHTPVADARQRKRRASERILAVVEEASDPHCAHRPLRDIVREAVDIALADRDAEWKAEVDRLRSQRDALRLEVRELRRRIER